jgi:hypothetical protein
LLGFLRNEFSNKQSIELNYSFGNEQIY